MNLSLFNKNTLIKFFLIMLFLAIVTEMVQLWVPARSFNVFDILANMTGIGLGVIIIKINQRHDASKVKNLEGPIM